MFCNDNKIVLYFTIITMLSFCSETSTKRKSGGVTSKVETSITDDEKKEASSSSESIEGTVYETSESTATENSNDELGIKVTAPKGLLTSSVTPKLKIRELENPFSNSIPGSGVLLGKGMEVEVLDESDARIEAANLNGNLNFKIKIPTEEVDENLAFVIRTKNGDMSSNPQIITPGDFQIHDNGETSELTFKAASPLIEFQRVKLSNQNLSNSEVYFPLPKNPLELSCIGDTPYSAYLSWGIPGGTVAAFKIIQSTVEATVVNDVGCTANTSFPDLPGTSRSFISSDLEPQRTYYFRICSKNSRYPSDASPGVVCSITTPSPNIPTVQVAFTYDYNFYYGKKSAGDWLFDTIASGVHHYESYNNFEIDKNDKPHLVWTTLGAQLRYTKLKDGIFDTTGPCCKTNVLHLKNTPPSNNI